MNRIGRTLATLLAPVLPFTSDEIWLALPGKKEESVHYARFETLDDLPEGSTPRDSWERLTRLREEVALMLEDARRDKQIGSSLEAAIALQATPDLQADRDRTGLTGAELADFFIVSEIVEDGGAADSGGWRNSEVYAGARLQFRKARGRRCDRCWKVTLEAEGNGLCDRCRGVLENSEVVA